MVQTRLWRSTYLVCLLPVLLLALTGVSAQAQPPPARPKVDRWSWASSTISDYMRPDQRTPDHNIQHDPAFEWLFEVDVSSVATIPGWQERENGQTASCASSCRRACSPPWLWRIHGQDVVHNQRSV